MTYTLPPFAYTAYFCEENIWHLGRALVQAGKPVEQLFVLLLTNAAQQTPLLQQRAGREPDGFVLWDYHVMLLAEDMQPAHIYDPDCRLGAVLPLKEYCAQCFLPPEQLPPTWQVKIRRIPLALWLRHFHSDRTHMRNAHGRELKPFPDYPPILVENITQRITLREYLDVEQTIEGSVFTDIYHFT